MTTKETDLVIPLMDYHDVDSNLHYIPGQAWQKAASPRSGGFSACMRSAETIRPAADRPQLRRM